MNPTIIYKNWGSTSDPIGGLLHKKVVSIMLGLILRMNNHNYILIKQFLE